MLFVGRRTREYYRWTTGITDERRYSWLPYPHDPDTYANTRPPAQHDDTSFRILYLGRLVAVKAVDRLLGAVHQLRRSDTTSNLQLCVAGDGPERQRLEDKARAAALRDITKFVGSVKPSNVPKVMEDADVVVLPSHREPWGLVVNEALSCGRPVVAPSWVGAVGDILLDGETGLVTVDNSSDALATALKRLARDRDWCRRLGEAGSGLVRSGGWNLATSVARFRNLFARESHPCVAERF
jgi:glycosyltransferase involved in cell wall biosynthesis